MDKECRMTAKEINRLSEWLKLKGVTEEGIEECIRYIYNAEENEETDFE